MTKDPPSKSRFFRDFEKLVSASAGSVRGDQLIHDLKGWDSLAILEFMVLASEYGRDVEPAEVARCRTVDDLASLAIAPGGAQTNTTDTPA